MCRISSHVFYTTENVRSKRFLRFGGPRLQELLFTYGTGPSGQKVPEDLSNHQKGCCPIADKGRCLSGIKVDAQQSVDWWRLKNWIEFIVDDASLFAINNVPHFPKTFYEYFPEGDLWT